MTDPRIITFPDMEKFYDSATVYIVDHLKGVSAPGQRTTLFLSGGSTPKTIYKRLSNASLDWAAIDVAQVDDRWVGLGDPGSNAKMIKHTLLKNRARSAKFYRIMSRHKSAKAGQSAVEANYQNLTMKGSLAVLGMGTDGHVCSWFPGAEGIEAALDPANDNRVQAILAKQSKVTGPYLERMTLTLSALVKCDSLLLLITGEEKKRVLQTAINDRTSTLPVRYLLDAVGDRLTVMCTG